MEWPLEWIRLAQDREKLWTYVEKVKGFYKMGEISWLDEERQIVKKDSVG